MVICLLGSCHCQTYVVKEISCNEVCHVVKLENGII